LCAADDADATALALAKRAIERRDDLSEAVEERARDWHDWFNGGIITRRLFSPSERCDASSYHDVISPHYKLQYGPYPLALL